jgi:hypothetical protein
MVVLFLLIKYCPWLHWMGDCTVQAAPSVLGENCPSTHAAQMVSLLVAVAFGSNPGSHTRL